MSDWQATLQFAGEHPIVTVLVVYAIYCTFKIPFHFWNRWLRSKNIAARGWPTAQFMDADGDIVHPEKD